MIDCENQELSLDGFIQTLGGQAFNEMVPLRGVFELTPRCNFNCKMCYIHLTDEQANHIGNELSNEEFLRVAREARDAGMLYLTLTGGEVFSRPKFKELYEELSKLGLLITILSNGSLIDESVMEWLSKTPPYCIRLTLYGASNETYEKVCGIKNGFDRVNHAINLLKNSGIPFFLGGTIIRDNYKDLIAMYKYAAQKKVFFRHTVGIIKPVRGAVRNIESQRISLTDVPEEEWKKNPPQRVKMWYNHSENPLYDCGSYRKGFCLSWNGKVSLCSFMSQPSVDIRTMTFANAWKSLNISLDKSIKKPSKCIGCKYEGFCRRCPGVLMAECGNPNQPDNEFCLQAKHAYQLYSIDSNLRKD